MGDKGKKDKGKREGQKKGTHTLKEKRKQKKEINSQCSKAKGLIPLYF